MNGDRGTETVASVDGITMTSGVKGGRPVLSGTKLSIVQVLELVEEGGLGPERIAQEYEGIESPDAVRAALEWAEENPDYVAELREQREQAKEEQR